MNGLVNLAWAVVCIGGAGYCLIFLIAERAGITRRLRHAGRLIAEAGPWFVSAVLHPWSLRGRRLPQMDPFHPAVKAARRRPRLAPALPVDGRPLDEYEQRALDSLELRARVPHQGEGR